MESVNGNLLTRAGMVEQAGSGIYSYLPLGLKSLYKIADVVRAEMNELGANEVLLPILHPKKYWETTKRFEAFDVLFKVEETPGKGTTHVLGPTHEEIVTPLVRQFASSYRDLPLAVYQIQTKLRNELRPKSGLLRGKEFLMKDLYSFHTNEEDLDNYYQKVVAAYGKIFQRLDLEVKLVKASGGAFSKYSDEFQVLCETGEDTIFYCDKCDFAHNQEIAEVKAGDKCPDCDGKIVEAKAIEVGNIFKLGSRFTEPFDFDYVDEKDQRHAVLMGCYGLGISRAMGAIVEVHHDDKGIIWPENVAPAQYHLIALGDDAKVKAAAEQLYDDLIKAGKEVIYDDRDASPGQKFADADLIGCPIRLTLSPKTLEKNSVEVKQRNSDESKLEQLSSF